MKKIILYLISLLYIFITQHYSLYCMNNSIIYINCDKTKQLLPVKVTSEIKDQILSFIDQSIKLEYELYISNEMLLCCTNDLIIKQLQQSSAPLTINPIKNIRTKEKTYGCLDCNRRCSSLTHLNTHTQKNHNKIVHSYLFKSQKKTYTDKNPATIKLFTIETFSHSLLDIKQDIDTNIEHWINTLL